MAAASTHTTTSAIEKSHPPKDPRTFWRVILGVLAPIPPIALAVSNRLVAGRGDARRHHLPTGGRHDH